MPTVTCTVRIADAPQVKAMLSALADLIDALELYLSEPSPLTNERLREKLDALQAELAELQS